MTPNQIRLYELRRLRDKLAVNRYTNRAELAAIRKEIYELQDYISAERREKNAPKKKSVYDSINADKYFWEQAYKEGKL
jgi:TPP-dependent pyruvate/acetoin dehydrogenase alpha subunit